MRLALTLGLSILLSGAALADTGTPMAVDDLILDADTLRGKTVLVRGFVACIGNNGTCMLFDNPSGFTKNVMFDASGLTRADRAKLNDCNVLSGCKVTLSARVINKPLENLQVIGMDWGSGMSAAETSSGANVVGPAGTISVKDFILDSAGLVGRTVTVRGSAWCESGTSCVLMERGWMQQQAAQFNASALSRDERRKLLSCLEGLNPGCAAEVTGVVRREGRLEASSITWR